MRTFIKKWEWFKFILYSVPTEQYANFNKWFKRIMKNIATNLWWTIEWFKPNHFDTSWFITVGDKHVFISISDVRYFKDEWKDHILYRTAKDTNDYMWWSNKYTTLINLRWDLDKIFNN